MDVVPVQPQSLVEAVDGYSVSAFLCKVELDGKATDARDEIVVIVAFDRYVMAVLVKATFVSHDGPRIAGSV